MAMISRDAEPIICPMCAYCTTYVEHDGSEEWWYAEFVCNHHDIYNNPRTDCPFFKRRLELKDPWSD